MSEEVRIKFANAEDAAFVLNELLKTGQWREKLYFSYSGKSQVPYSGPKEAMDMMELLGMGASCFSDDYMAESIIHDVLSDNVDRIAQYAVRDTKRCITLTKKYDYPVGRYYSNLEDKEGAECYGVRIVVRKSIHFDTPLGIFIPFANPSKDTNAAE